MFGITAGGALVAAAIMSLAPTTHAPRVLIQAKSYAVVFVPAENLDFVQAVRPRFSVDSGGAQFGGVRFDDSLSVRAFRGTPDDASVDTTVYLMQSLDVTPDCTVRIEHWVDRKIRLKIERSPPTLPTDTARCVMFAELLTKADESIVVERVIESESPVDLKFAPHTPLRLRHIPVTELRFETEEAGQLRKAILGESRLQSSAIEATLMFPDYGGDDETHTARLGDVVKLGRLQGELVELIVGDTMRTMYKGRAEAPEIAGRRLRPSFLEQLAAHDAFRTIILILVSLLGIAVGLFGSILK